MAIVDSSSYSRPEFFFFKKMASFGGVYYLLETLRIAQNVEGSPQGRTSVCTPSTR